MSADLLKRLEERAQEIPGEVAERENVDSSHCGAYGSDTWDDHADNADRILMLEALTRIRELEAKIAHNLRREAATTARTEAKVASDNNRPQLSVWYGKMPESNGKSNWTASLYRTGGGDVHMGGFCFARSEYADRVRYEADRMRWIIGELAEKPLRQDRGTEWHSPLNATTKSKTTLKV